MKPILPITVPFKDQRCRPSMLRRRGRSCSVWTGLKKQNGWGGISGYLPKANNIFFARSNDTHRRGILACYLLEFFLNAFYWIQRIQWIMTKSKSGMFTKVITHLLTNTLPVLVIKKTADSSRKFFFTTTSTNVTTVRCRMSLVTMLVLDFVMIHWIRWIQRKSFRENSIAILPDRYHAFDLQTS